MKHFCFIPSLFLLALSTFNTSTAHAAELQSVSRIAFGPDNTLFLADWKAGQIVAVELPAATDTSSNPYNLMDFEAAVTKAVGSRDIRIEDLRARPNSNEVYLALSVGPTRRPEIVFVQPRGTVKTVNIKALRTYASELKDTVDWTYNFWNHIPERSFTVTDMEWHKGKLYVAGLSNQSFASTLRMLDYPFNGRQGMTSVEIFHTSHAEIETRAPIRDFTFATLGGKDYLIAAYLCTPLVTIPVDEIKDGAHITGKTIAELGYGNTPDGLLSFTAKEQGKNVDYVLISNIERNAEVVALADLQAANEKEGISQWVPFGAIVGVTPVQTPFAGVYRIDNLNSKYFIALRRDLATGRSQLITFDKDMRFRGSDFVSEYNFPGYIYRGKMQIDGIKPAQDLLKSEEGFRVTTDLQVNGPFPPK